MGRTPIELISDELADIENIDLEFWQDFVIETRERLEQIEADVLVLEHEPENSEAVNSIFREFHTIKGIAGVVKHQIVQIIAHQTETLLDSARNGQIQVSRIIADLILNSADYIKKACDSLELCKDPKFHRLVNDHLIKVSNKGSLIGDEDLAGGVSETDIASEKEAANLDSLISFVIDTKEHLEKIAALVDANWQADTAACLQKEFKEIGGLARSVNLNTAQRIAQATALFLNNSGGTGAAQQNLIAISSALINKICGCFELNKNAEFLTQVEKHLLALDNLFLANHEINPSHDSSEALDNHERNLSPDSSETAKIESIIFSPGDELLAASWDMPGCEEEQSKESVIEDKGRSSLNENKTGMREASQTSKLQEAGKNDKGSIASNGSFIRIPTYKVDNLVDTMGELIIMQSLIEQEAVSRFNSNDRFINNLLRISRITKEMQNLSMSLRMVSLKSTFRKINRIGRDTIAELGKNAGIVMSGEETEIDRGVAEKIFEPLIHLIRNSISHGIEDEKERLAKGKPANGLVKVEASSKRGNVYIEISDDGRGIDVDKVYDKALEKGLIDPSADYDEDEILNFIFLPGFSTAEKVDNISGRGVGLDVVKTEICKNSGKVDVESRLGQGCRFILKIPINLAVMNGTIVDIMGTNYIIPTLQVKRIFKPSEDQWVSVKGNRTMIRVRDEIIQLIPIPKIFGLNTDDRFNENGIIIVLELEQKLKALAIRKIIGKREIVVKPLDAEFSNLNFISGASILGDGKVALIIDVEFLFKKEVEV